jgi:hypothetical protein
VADASSHLSTLEVLQISLHLGCLLSSHNLPDLLVHAQEDAPDHTTQGEHVGVALLCNTRACRAGAAPVL